MKLKMNRFTKSFADKRFMVRNENGSSHNCVKQRKLNWLNFKKFIINTSHKIVYARRTCRLQQINP